MADYRAPLRDMRFNYFEMFDGDEFQALPGIDEADTDLVNAILEEGAKLAEDVLHPINQSGDEQGSRLENGVVRTPDGFKEAYTLYAEGGWTGLTADPDWGGQGLPVALGVLVSEFINAANHSFAMFPGLAHGAYEALKHHATEDLQRMFLPKLVDGRWTGTMCLTEPQCGTDLGLLRSRAVPQNDGSYAITGTKIFISGGDHDLTDNIVHLVLARLPDAPAGIRGISLFVIPKFKVGEDGRLGAANGVTPASLEQKMGIHASPTCVLNFDGAQGWLVGQPHKGMRAMFTFMNAARLHVGVQGLSLAEASYQGAVAYARERLQGRSLTGAKYPDKPADPILVHPDVRRMLLTMRAHVEGSRMLTQWIGRELDIKARHPDPARQRQADDLTGLLTPVVKALQTDLGFETTNLGMQVLGGHGYVRDHGMEQYARDCRITQIYEGTNGIQALDLVGRKMPAHTGRALRYFFHPVQACIDSHADTPQMAEFVQPLAKAFGRLQMVSATLAQKSLGNPDEAGAAANDYLRLFGLVALAYLWVRAVERSLPRLDGDDAGFYRAKINTARFFMQKILPQTSGLVAAIMTGANAVMDFADEDF